MLHRLSREELAARCLGRLGRVSHLTVDEVVAWYREDVLALLEIIDSESVAAIAEAPPLSVTAPIGEVGESRPEPAWNERITKTDTPKSKSGRMPAVRLPEDAPLPPPATSSEPELEPAPSTDDQDGTRLVALIDLADEDDDPTDCGGRD